MATIINNPDPNPRVVERETIREVDSGTGWVVAVIILLAVIGLGIFLWPKMMRNTADTSATTPPQGNANINVTLPPVDSGNNNPPANNNGDGAANGDNPEAPVQ